MLIQFCFSFPTASCNYGSHLTDANIGSNFTPGVIPLGHGSKVKAWVLRHWCRYCSRNLLDAVINGFLVPGL